MQPRHPNSFRTHTPLLPGLFFLVLIGCLLLPLRLDRSQSLGFGVLLLAGPLAILQFLAAAWDFSLHCGRLSLRSVILRTLWHLFFCGVALYALLALAVLFLWRLY